jgi:hypothetical protein
VSFFLTLLAHAEGRANQRDQALDHLAEAERLLTETEDRAEGELNRVRGDALHGLHDHAAAERSFSQAVRIAQRESAKFWELGIAISLARLWHEQGKREEARDFLVSSYGWFSEGFNTPLLTKARALLGAWAP